jgi:transcriptional regulator with XRE-family HTH domain
MENLIGKRIKLLRKTYNLGLKDFASYCQLSHVAIFHLENGKTSKPHRRSLQKMADNFGTSINWIINGEDEMLPKGKVSLKKQDVVTSDFWKEEAYNQLKDSNKLLEKEVERLWQIIQLYQNANQKSFRNN